MRAITETHNPGITGAMFADTNKIDYVSLGEGVRFKLLRFCKVTGDWVLYVEMQPGVKFGRHKHISPAEFFVLKGTLTFEGGSAHAGVYAYEEIGEIHEEACGEEVTEFLYFGHGPVAFIDTNDNLQFIADLEFYSKAWDGDLPANIIDEEKSASSAAE